MDVDKITLIMYLYGGNMVFIANNVLYMTFYIFVDIKRLVESIFYVVMNVIAYKSCCVSEV